MTEKEKQIYEQFKKLAISRDGLPFWLAATAKALQTKEKKLNENHYPISGRDVLLQQDCLFLLDNPIKITKTSSTCRSIYGCSMSAN